MAGYERRGEVAVEILNLLLFLNVFSSNLQMSHGFEGDSPVFIQTDNELRYMVDPNQVLVNNEYHDVSPSNSPIRFEPNMLDFDKHPVGMPHKQTVAVHNPDTINSLHLLSISGSTLHFHCSFFQDKMVPPGGNTTFEVVFLARQVGNVENTLYIHTSQGTFKYQVFGVGIPNPYRLRPFLGAKVPVNSTFAPLINMHNPHNTALQVTEMYSSGGDLHLELPTGDKDAPKNLWEIPPFETKPVMRASFLGRTASNHTAFIRIKTSKEENEKETLVLPVEVEVSSAPGLYSPVELLDFGILRTLDGPKTLRLNLYNSGSRPIQIQSVTVVPANDAISVDFRPVKVQKDVLQPTMVALITYTAAKAIHPKQHKGKIVVKSKNHHFKLTIPYQADVLHGSLIYDANSTKFYVGSKVPLKNTTSPMMLTNSFNFTLVIYNVTVPPEMTKYFSIVNFTSPVLVPAKQTICPFRLKFHPNTTDVHFSTLLRVYTNASVFHIPLHVYNGKLKVIHHRPEIFKGQLDFGVMGVGDHRRLTFTLRNDNPIDIIVSEFSSNMLGTKVELLGVERGNGTALTRDQNVSEIDTNPLVIKPFHFAVFRVNLHAPEVEGSYAAEVLIYTQFETQYIPITLMTVEGGLMAVPEVTMFEDVYPGKVFELDFRINSTFDGIIEAGEVLFIPQDPRFYFKKADISPLWIYYHDKNIIGTLYFDPKRDCGDDCYVGLPTHTPAGHQWLLGLTLDKDVPDTDQYLYTRLQQKWEAVGSRDKNPFNVTVQLNTDYVRGFLFPAQVHFKWPSTIEENPVLDFPLTQIGNRSELYYIVRNPSSQTLLVQILPLSLYPNPQIILDMLQSKISEELTDYVETDDLDIFTMLNLELYDKRPNASVTEFRQDIADLYGIKPHKHTISALIGGESGLRLLLGFSPKDDSLRSTLIIIRNNFTIIDALVVRGKGSYGQIKFSGRKPGSPNALTFEITDKHLKGCDRVWKPNQRQPPSFTVKRTFTLRNTGELPFYVQGFSINSEACEGYGFKVLDCRGFEIKPNESRKIDIAFTPDFTMSRIRRLLKVRTSLGEPINYTLQATVPASMLTKCSAALPRPNWEPIVYYSTVCLMGFLLFCIFVASYFEGDRIFTTDMLKRQMKLLPNSTQPFDKGKVFDLKAIGLKTMEKTQIRNTVNVSNGTPAAEVKRKRDSLPSVNSAGVHHNPPSRQNSIEAVPTKIVYEKQNSREKEAKTTPPPILIPNPTVQYNGILDRVQSSAKNNKKGKAKQNPSSLNTVENGVTYPEKPKSNKETTTTQKKVCEEVKNENKANIEKNNNHRKHIITTSPSDSIATLDSFEVPDVTMVTLVDDTLENDNGNQDKGAHKNKRRVKTKSKTAARREEKGRRQKEKAKRKEEVVDEVDNFKDDSSSTTESSCLDIDEKNPSTRETTPEPIVKKNKKARSNSAKKSPKTVCSELDTIDDITANFNMHTKNKTQAKKNMDQKDVYGILRPSNLSLPYNPKVENDKTFNDKVSTGGLKEEPTSPHAIAADIAAKALKKNMKGVGKSKGHNLVTMPTYSSSARFVHALETTDSDVSNSPPPLWDQPKPVPKNGDFGEFASQTSDFQAAMRQGKGHPNTTSPDPLASSSRSSSYSSIVSNSSGDGHGRHGKGNRNQVSAFSPVGGYEHQGSGPLGNPTAIPGKAVNANTMKPAWSMNPGVTSEIGSGAFPLPSINEGSHSSLDDLDSFRQTSPTYGFNDGYGSSMYEQPTMMQKLQRERRRRLQEYQQKMMREQEWPGFDINPMQSDSLWDNFAPSDPVWSGLGDSGQNGQNTLWGGLSSSPPTSNSGNNSWNSVSAIWGSTGTPDTSLLEPGSGNSSSWGNTGNSDTSLLEPANGNAGLNASTEKQETNENMGSFDPFKTLASIWTPGGGASGSSWGFGQPKEGDTEE